MSANGTNGELVALNRIAEALSTITAIMVTKHVESNMNSTTLYQLAGNAKGFADELESILDNSMHEFQRSKGLRNLVVKANNIAEKYAEQADAEKAGDAVESEDGKETESEAEAQAWERSKIPRSGEVRRGW